MLLSGYLDNLGIMKEYANVADRFWVETVNTIIYAAVAVTIATAVGVYLGMLAFRNQHLERPIFATVSVFQTIPGLAMVGLLVAPFAAASFAVPLLRRLGIGGIGWAPVVTALTLYALLAIVRNTYAGLRNVPLAVVDAGRGMGMTDGQLMRKVELPLGMPVVFSGVRTSTVQTIGNATLGAFVGGITLGRFIFQGLAEQSPDLTMLGSIALVVIAVLADGALRIVQSRLFRTHSVGGEGSLP
jgi:osmoprotectant transport system permease protein